MIDLPPPPPAIVRGYATYFDEGVFQKVYANRLRWQQVTPCPECVGYVALPDCADLDKRVWVRHAGEWVGPLHAIDCAAAQDVASIRQRGIVVEVDYWLAQQWGMRGPASVEVIHD